MTTDPRRRTAVITATIAGFALVVGLLIGTLIGAPFNVQWFEAVGTWLGSIATIGAVIWAVRVFQHEQQIRRAGEAARIAERVALVEREEALQESDRRERDRQIRAEAALVTIDVRGGGGFGQPGERVMTEFVANVTNATQKLVTRVRVWVSGGLEPKSGIDLIYGIEQSELDIRNLRIGETATWSFGNVALRDVPDAQWGGQPLTVKPVSIEYCVDGRTWRRVLDGQPQKV